MWEGMSGRGELGRAETPSGGCVVKTTRIRPALEQELGDGGQGPPWDTLASQQVELVEHGRILLREWGEGSGRREK